MGGRASGGGRKAAFRVFLHLLVVVVVTAGWKGLGGKGVSDKGRGTHVRGAVAPVLTLDDAAAVVLLGLGLG
jgi:predicted ABC-type sugar transport system permease subunit